MARRTSDVVIVGGGVMGSAVAYFLCADGHTGRVLVVERDLTYRHASRPRRRRGNSCLT